jgi:hypothetical protein
MIILVEKKNSKKEYASLASLPNNLANAFKFIREEFILTAQGRQSSKDIRYFLTILGNEIIEINDAYEQFNSAWSTLGALLQRFSKSV